MGSKKDTSFSGETYGTKLCECEAKADMVVLVALKHVYQEKGTQTDVDGERTLDWKCISRERASSEMTFPR